MNTSESTPLSPKVAVITAASRGIGAATATAFGREGFDVVVNYAQNEAAAREVAHAIEALGRKALTIQADVFTEQGAQKLFEAAHKEFGNIDVLVNNAGFPEEPPFGAWTHDTVNKSLNANITSAVLCTQAGVPLMRKGGSILFTSSIYGLNFGGNPSLALYSAGKAAIVNFAQTMAEHLAPHIRCNVVAPGFTKTPAWDGTSPEYVQRILQTTLQNEWVAAEEIADAFVFLAKTPHVNGQTITVDGGWQKRPEGF